MVVMGGVLSQLSFSNGWGCGWKKEANLDEIYQGCRLGESVVGKCLFLSMGMLLLTGHREPLDIIEG